MVLLGDAHSCSLPFFYCLWARYLCSEMHDLETLNSQADDPRVTPGRNSRSFSLPPTPQLGLVQAC